jgi:cytochrome c oxidase subunit 2
VLEATITGHQWWWDIRYDDKTPANIFSTANELHVPVGQTVRLKLDSADVIHSVWIPNLAGKRDVIPGRSDSLFVRADKPGIWRGRCGEFCGLQHSYMELLVVAQPPAQFRAWQAGQRRPAGQPSGEALRGKDLFEKGPCAVCHVIRGTSATGRSMLAPDLTHLKSRQTIGAGAAPNTRERLAAWIADPHAAKPGVHMPPLPQRPAEMAALLSYLETLK